MKRRITWEERYKDVPYARLLKPRERCHIPSVFMFKDIEELFSFLAASRDGECEVYFENEDLLIGTESTVAQNIQLMLYVSMASDNGKMVNDYLNYLMSSMNTGLRDE